MVPVDMGKKYRNYFLQDVVMRKMEKVFSKVPQGEQTWRNELIPQQNPGGKGQILPPGVGFLLPQLCFPMICAPRGSFSSCRHIFSFLSMPFPIPNSGSWPPRSGSWPTKPPKRS